MTGMNRSIKRIAIAVLVMFVILLVDVNYLQAVQAPSLANRPLNDRTEYEQSQVQRGNIVTADGKTIATSTPATSGLFKWQRSYPGGAIYAPVTGYDTLYTQSQAPNYAAGVERAQNALLTGTGSELAFRNFIDMITNKPQKGATVQTTINSAAQKTAYEELRQILRGKTLNGKQQVGGVVALNPATGAILAMASYPSYDPNQLATHDTTTLNQLYTQLSQASPSPLINNAAQTTMPPGSTFKIVTSSAWYTQDATRNTQTVVDSPQPLILPNGNPLNNDSNEQCGNGSGKTQVIIAFAQSCNTPFAKIGTELGGATIKSTATSYGLNNPAALDIPGVTVSPSNFTAESDPSFTALRRDRPARHHGDGAAGGDVRRDGRQRRRADEALPDPAGHGQRPVGGTADPGAGAEPPDLEHRRGLREGHDDRRGAGPRGHRERVQREQRAGPRHRRQDRHRTEWQRKRHS